LELIKFEDNLYPVRLKEIKDAPKKLYVEGDINNLNNQCVAIVGSRKCTEYGKKWCKVFVKELVKYGITIVSGMAIGIDTIAHDTAIKSGGKTIAVLPCGLENIYPKENSGLYKNIISNGGTIITEYEPEKKASSDKFLERNRIVSGLSIAVLVVEAAYRSGTSVTAKFAKEQNRDVFCIPRKS
jgi:DNA processing protein